MTETIEPMAAQIDQQRLAEDLAAQAREEGVQLVGEGGLLTGLTKSVVETALEEQISEHLGYDKHDPAGRNGGNSRNDGGTAHQPPESGQDKWFHARVRNTLAGGQCRHFVVTFDVKEFAGTEIGYLDDFLPCVAARAGFDVAPVDTRVVSARWPRDRVPAPGTHPCLLVAVLTRSDHTTAGAHVWEHANLAQKNLTEVDLVPGEFLILPVVIQNISLETKAVLEVWRDPELPETDVALVHRKKELFASGRPRPLPLPLPPRPGRDQLMDCGGRERRETDRVGGILTSRRPEQIASRFPNAVELPVRSGDRVQVPVTLASETATVVGPQDRDSGGGQARDDIHHPPGAPTAGRQAACRRSRRPGPGAGIRPG